MVKKKIVSETALNVPAIRSEIDKAKLLLTNIKRLVGEDEKLAVFVKRAYELMILVERELDG